jgi:hypothetical protein
MVGLPVLWSSVGVHRRSKWLKAINLEVTMRMPNLQLAHFDTHNQMSTKCKQHFFPFESNAAVGTVVGYASLSLVTMSGVFAVFIVLVVVSTCAFGVEILYAIYVRHTIGVNADKYAVLIRVKLATRGERAKYLDEFDEFLTRTSVAVRAKYVKFD